MLFKDLKEIVTEANEPKLDDEGNPIEEPKSEAPRKTQKQKNLSKSTADGVGNEADDIASQVAEFLGSVLSQSYKVGDVEAEESMVVIHDAAYLMNKDAEEVTNTIQQYVIASIGAEGMKKFEINGPFKAGNNINLVFQLA